MADRCEHQHVVSGILHFDFARPFEPESHQYSAAIRVSVCEECGHLELHTENQRQLCSWLEGRWSTVH
jgi:hypothetical protein